jgi:hypothetical protein
MLTIYQLSGSYGQYGIKRLDIAQDLPDGTHYSAPMLHSYYNQPETGF